MVRLWLIFAQAATVAVAVLFVISTFRPEWLPSRAPAGQLSVVQQAPATGPLPAVPSKIGRASCRERVYHPV